MCGHRLGQRKNKTTAINQGKVSEMLAYLVREHDKTSQTRKIGNMMKSFGNEKKKKLMLRPGDNGSTMLQSYLSKLFKT